MAKDKVETMINKLYDAYTYFDRLRYDTSKDINDLVKSNTTALYAVSLISSFNKEEFKELKEKGCNTFTSVCSYEKALKNILEVNIFQEQNYHFDDDDLEQIARSCMTARLLVEKTNEIEFYKIKEKVKKL